MSFVEIPPVEGQQIVYADLHKNQYSPGYSLIIKKCRFCRLGHSHSGQEGHRSAHCFNRRTGKKIPVGGYTLKVDWSKPENAEMRAEYAAFYHKANES